MPSKGGYAAAPRQQQGGDRFYSPPAVRRQQIYLQQQEIMQRQLLQQQHQQQQHQEQQLEQQRKMQRRGREKVTAEYSSPMVAVEAEKPTGEDDSSMVAALPVPRSFNPASTLKLTNLDRLMESVTPVIEARYTSEVYAGGFRNTEVDSHTFFYLEDLWESFSEWSAYGRGVPLLLNGRDPIQQYYVPYLSGIQLYINPSKASTRISGHTQEIDADLYRLKNYGVSSARSRTNIADSSSLPLFQFLEKDSPYERRPLFDKILPTRVQISLLASQFPELCKSRSCDLLPTSWICVAWYPIYRIPVGPTLKDLGASFLAFHSLSTQPRSSPPPSQFHQANTRTVGGFLDPITRISLPVALATCRQKGSILHPFGPQESEQENSLFQSADDWLRRLQVALPDHEHFCRKRSQWR